MRTHGLLDAIATGLAASSRELAARWLEVLRARIPEHPRRIFPDQTLLNHIPQLIERIAKAAQNGEDLADNPFINKELRGLADLRRSQGYEVEELVEEFDLLEAIIFEEARLIASKLPDLIPAAEAVESLDRLRRALQIIVNITLHAFRGIDVRDRVERTTLLSSFGRNVSHELRNRLNSANLGVQLARAGHPDALETVERALLRVASVVDDVYTIAISQDTANSRGHERREFSQLVDEVLDDLRILAEEQTVELRTLGTLPDFLVDAPRLRIVMANLVSNAIKYRDKGKQQGWIEIRTERLPRAGEWRIDIADNGPGVPPELCDSIFTPSVRGTNELEGEGLGLAIARKAVDQLGGRIWVSTNPGQGSVFSFTLCEPREDLTIHHE